MMVLEMRSPGEKGFTLIELVIAILIFAIGVAGIVKMYTHTTQLSSYSLQLTQAVNIGQSHMDMLRSLSFDNDTMNIASHNTKMLTEQSVNYHLSWDVENRNTIPASRDVFVSVRWLDKGTNRIIVLRGLWDESK